MTKYIKVYELEFFTSVKNMHPSYANYLNGYVKAKTGLSFSHEFPAIQAKVVQNPDNSSRLLLMCYTEKYVGIIKKIFWGDKEINLNGIIFRANVKELTEITELCGDHAKFVKYKMLSPGLMLNQKNDNAWHNAKDKRAFLENIITSQILGVSRGVGIRLDNRIEVRVADFVEFPVKSLGIAMKGFIIEFSANVLLPKYVSIGKRGTSGFGITKLVGVQY